MCVVTRVAIGVRAGYHRDKVNSLQRVIYLHQIHNTLSTCSITDSVSKFGPPTELLDLNLHFRLQFFFYFYVCVLCLYAFLCCISPVMINKLNQPKPTISGFRNIRKFRKTFYLPDGKGTVVSRFIQHINL